MTKPSVLVLAGVVENHEDGSIPSVTRPWGVGSVPLEVVLPRAPWVQVEVRPDQ